VVALLRTQLVASWAPLAQAALAGGRGGASSTRARPVLRPRGWRAPPTDCARLTWPRWMGGTSGSGRRAPTTADW